MRLPLVAIAALVLIVAASCGGSSPGPPAGLTKAGTFTWNLDALLHDTFGDRQVWEDYKQGFPEFSTRFLDRASSVPYFYTFANARHSPYRTVHPPHPPTVARFATGSDEPIRVDGAYVDCGHGRWLYEHEGQAIPEGPVFCAKSHR